MFVTLHPRGVESHQAGRTSYERFDETIDQRIANLSELVV